MDIILPIITLVVGTFLGLLPSIYLAYFQHKQDITGKVLDQYFAAREQLCDQLSALANLLVTNSCQLDVKIVAEYQENVSKLFYKYYDLLPPEVLKEMLCLHTCLSDKENRLYKHENNFVLLIEDQDIEGFIEGISLIDNFKYYAAIPLRSKDSHIRRSASINYQARSVLVSINRHFTVQHFISWNRYLQKSKGLKSKRLDASFNHHNLLQTTIVGKGIISWNHNDIEDRLRVLMASILGSSRVEPDDNFFDLGGESLAALELVSHINREFNVHISPIVIFKASTPQQLATEILQYLPDYQETSNIWTSHSSSNRS